MSNYASVGGARRHEPRRTRSAAADRAQQIYNVMIFASSTSSGSALPGSTRSTPRPQPASGACSPASSRGATRLLPCGSRPDGNAMYHATRLDKHVRLVEAPARGWRGEEGISPADFAYARASGRSGADPCSSNRPASAQRSTSASTLCAVALRGAAKADAAHRGFQGGRRDAYAVGTGGTTGCPPSSAAPSAENVGPSTPGRDRACAGPCARPPALGPAHAR